MDWMSVLGKVAPTLAKAVLGPLAGVAVEVIGGALGLEDKTEEAIKQALSGTTPEQLLVLKKADQDFALRVQELGLKREELAFGYDKEQLTISAADRDSARRRETIVLDKTPRNLAYAVTAGFFGVLGSLMWGEIDASSKDVLLVMLGSLGTAWISIIAYYFGSTTGSKRATELLAKSQPVNE